MNIAEFIELDVHIIRKVEMEGLVWTPGGNFKMAFTSP